MIRGFINLPGGDVIATRALLVGINKSQVPGADLRGCVNDVKDLSEALIKFYGFKKRDIQVLLDTAATQKAMQPSITALLRGAKKGDVPVLHYKNTKADRLCCQTKNTHSIRYNDIFRSGAPRPVARATEMVSGGPLPAEGHHQKLVFPGNYTMCFRPPARVFCPVDTGPLAYSRPPTPRQREPAVPARL